MAKILITDDERMMRNLLSEMFGKIGHEVETAFNGSDALRLFAEKPFDLVTTNYDMPVMDGYILARRIKQKSPNTPVILITGKAPAVTTQNKMDEYIDLVLTKPFAFRAIENIAAKFISSARPKR